MPAQKSAHLTVFSKKLVLLGLASVLLNGGLMDIPALAEGLPPLQGRVATAPAGTFVMASFSSPVSSEYARVGDRFTANLASDLNVGGSTILPAGTQLEAQVFSVQSAGRTGRNGQLDVRFTQAILPGGQRVPLYARLQTEDGTGIIKGGTGADRFKGAALRTGTGAAAGAILGTVMGPLSGGRVGRGAVYGTAVGAGAGALYSAVKKGVEAMIPAGQPVNIVLDQPVTVTPGADYGNGYPSGGYNNNYNPGYNGGYNNYNGSYGQQAPYNAYPQQQQQASPPPYNYNNYGGYGN